MGRVFELFNLRRNNSIAEFTWLPFLLSFLISLALIICCCMNRFTFQDIICRCMNELTFSDIILVFQACLLFWGLRHWKRQRQENSFEKYYDRLERANAAGGVFHFSRNVVPHLTSPLNHEEALYVYSEIDMLEYVITKYKLGYMTKEDTFRGLTTFLSRCRSKPFLYMLKILASKCAYPPNMMVHIQSLINNEKKIKEICSDLQNAHSSPEKRRTGIFERLTGTR